jgi:peptidoglycan/LPS O-acetylase OafA/YrhL
MAPSRARRNRGSEDDAQEPVALAAALALLIAAAAVGLYASIAGAEMGYWIALTILVLASFLSAWSGRRGGLSRRA